MTELKSNIEIIWNDKTFVSKKMNPIRRALIIDNIISKAGQQNADVSANTKAMSELFSTHLPKTMWEFIKDEDKKEIGTYETFIDLIDDKSCLEFFEWSIEKINELNSFLGSSQKAQA